jgi:hypothetical protein
LAADPVPQNDLLNAELWMQTAIEYRANCLTVYALARVRLDEALADTNWTAYDQTGSYQNLPPAVIIDLDETAIDNSPYEAGLVHRRRLSGLFSFNPDRPDGPLCLNLDLPFSRWLATGRTSPDSRAIGWRWSRSSRRIWLS